MSAKITLNRIMMINTHGKNMNQNKKKLSDLNKDDIQQHFTDPNGLSKNYRKLNYKICKYPNLNS